MKLTLLAALLAYGSAAASAGDLTAPAPAPDPVNGPTAKVQAPSLPNGAGVISQPGQVGNVDLTAGGQTTLANGPMSAQGPTAIANGGAASAQGAAPSAEVSNGFEAAPMNPAAARTRGAASSIGVAHQSQVPAQKASANTTLTSAVDDIRKAQKPDAVDHDAAGAIRKLFDAEKSRADTIAGPPDEAASPAQSAAPAGTGGVRAKAQALQDRIAQKAELAGAPTTSPHDAPALYQDAIKTADAAATQGLMSAQTAKAVTRAILGYAARGAKDALASIANSAYAAAAKGDDAGRREVERALGTETTKGSIDQWNDLLSTPGQPLLANKERLKSDIARVLSETTAAGAVIARSGPRVTISEKGPLALEANLPASSVSKIPDSFLSTLAAPRASAPSLSPRPRQPFEPGFSVFDGYRRLREQGVASWPAAKFVVKTEARAVYELVAGRASPAVSPDETDRLLAQVESHYAAGDAKGVAGDYASLTGDRDAVAAVSAADSARWPQARTYWLERLHDAAQSRRAPKTQTAEKPSASANQLSSFAAYVAAHRAEAASNVDAIEADASLLSTLTPVGVVRAGGRDLWVERAVASRGKTRREAVLGFDAETREPLFGQLAR